jgi:N-acetylmuramoyl-L-alanine amidase
MSDINSQPVDSRNRERLKTIEKIATMPSYPTDITDKPGNHCTSRFPALFFTALPILIACLCNLPASAQSSAGKKFTVTLDAGHGGHDTGAPGKKSVEKNIALEIALKVGHYIESLMDDVDVYYTRKTDVFIPLNERAQLANRNKSDLFISIHVNANKKTAPTGTSTYVMGFSRSAENLDLVMQENKAILLEKDYQTKYAGFDPTSPESYIIFNNVQNNNLTQSLEIASVVQDQLRTRAQRKDIGVHQGNLVVLWGCAKPSILIETGFISNPQEEEFLMTDNGQDIIASAIYTAFRGYKETVDSRVNATTNTPVSQVVTDKVTTGNEKMATDSVKKAVEIAVMAPEKDALSQALAAPAFEFRIQVLASQKKLSLDSREFKGVKNIREYELDGYYKYMSHPVTTYQEALDLRQQLAASFKGAFIVRFKNGERVPLNSLSEERNN